MKKPYQDPLTAPEAKKKPAPGPRGHKQSNPGKLRPKPPSTKMPTEVNPVGGVSC
jgi:hypothetical protein